MPTFRTSARDFFAELKTPCDVIISVLTRLLASNPHVVTYFRRTGWLRSASGICHFYPSVWFDGELFHGVVYLHRGTEPSVQTAQIVWRCQHTNWRDAHRVARKQAIGLVTLKTVF